MEHEREKLEPDLQQLNPQREVTPAPTFDRARPSDEQTTGLQPSQAADTSSPEEPPPPVAPSRPGIGSGWKKVLVALAVLVAGYLAFSPPGAVVEDGPSAPNWSKHTHNIASTITLADEDRDSATTAAAIDAIRSGRQIPETASLTSGLKQEIINGDAHFYHIYLYDSCYEDGDIVDVLINGTRFAEVPLTNKGMTISVPISSKQANTIEILGMKDGGGGITVACLTSQGESFSRILAPGDVQLLGVALR